MTNSSEYIRALELPDLAEDLPEAETSPFEEHSEFERMSRTIMREKTAQQAHREGFAEGEAAGRAAVHKELEPAMEEIRAAARSMAHIRQQRLADAEAELVDVAAEIARRILRSELAGAGDTVLHMARACIQEAADEGALTLLVAPGDVELVRAHLPELELDLADASVQVRAEASLEPGHVVLQTPRRVYDGRPERILEAAAARVQQSGEES